MGTLHVHIGDLPTKPNLKFSTSGSLHCHSHYRSKQRMEDTNLEMSRMYRISKSINSRISLLACCRERDDIMKYLLALFTVCLLGISANAQEIKILTIGNSFSDSIFHDLPLIVKSIPDCDIILKRASLGGSELARHCAEIIKCEENPDYRPYEKNRKSLKELLQEEKWNIVTLQQVSSKSFQPETFEPHLKQLIDYVHKFAPSAEIVLHMTWSYHPSHKLYKSGSVKTPEEMFQKIKEAYAFYAKKYQFRVIPSGVAVNLARSQLDDEESAPEDLSTYVYPDRPVSMKYLVNIAYWSKPDENGNRQINSDRIHLNGDGKYLQSCLWFSELFGRNTSEIKYVPREMSEAKAKFYREMAQKAIDEYKQPKDE